MTLPLCDSTEPVLAGAPHPAPGQPEPVLALGVRYLASLQDDTGCSGETVCTEAPLTLRALLGILAVRHGEPLRSHILDAAGSSLADGIFILVNGRHLSQLQGLETRLAAGDLISLVPIMEFG